MADPIPNKLTGLVHRKLVRELALGEENQTQLAEKYDVDPSAISRFAKRNAEEIAAVRADADNEFAGLLIVQKAYRLGTLEQLLREAMRPTTKVAPSGRVAYDENGNAIKEIQGDLASKLLKQAAEEMGQLPNRVTLDGRVDVHTSYTVVGVEPEDLE